MTDRRIISHVAAAVRNGFNRTEAEAAVLAEVACDAYEEAREAIPTFDQPTRFTVRGRGVFPADMLRHDHCWPVDGAINAISDHTYNNRNDGVSITLCAQSGRRITPARWRSFGWVVTDIDGVPTGPQ